ncbi:MFS transporter [Paenibacillus gyeongsangnamensis]|uniref:MFS transporter n=1 Tax=Paenibacillus gyeongsangnamensis TaxID=3388067 RepID=UPI0039082E54
MGLLFKETSENAWRWLFNLGVVPSAIIFLARSSLPESPVWLAIVRRMQEAAEAGSKLGAYFHLFLKKLRRIS